MKLYLERNNELYHFGVKGMKWGRRQARSEYEADIEKSHNKYQKTADEAFKKLKKYDDEFKQLNDEYCKKYGEFADEWDGNVVEEYSDKHDEISKRYHADPNYQKAIKAQSKANKLDKNAGKSGSYAGAAIGAMVVAPFAMAIAGSLTKRADVGVKVGAILAAGFGSIAVTSIAAGSGTNKMRRDAAKEEGIKSVNERMREHRALERQKRKK